MIASLLIIGSSIALLSYWFRYSCILLLRNRSDQAARASAIEDQRFGFVQVQQQLPSCSQLDPLHQLLQRDYQLLTYLLDHAAGVNLESVEDRLLVLDYRVMAWYYRLTRTVAPEQARRALSEMASILAVLVDQISQRAGLHSEV